MGKGDIKSFVGKLFRKSYGKYRPRKKKRRENRTHENRCPLENMETAPSVHTLEKGDIVWAKNKNNHPHPIVFLEDNESTIKAAILSSKPTGKNIIMKPEYFCSEYAFPRKKNNYLITEYSFIKKEEWINPQKIGRLTDEGINFVENHIPREAIYYPHSISTLASAMNEIHERDFDIEYFVDEDGDGSSMVCSF
jgi:ribosomal small subunit protein bTHX